MSMPWRDLGVVNSGVEGDRAKSSVGEGRFGLIWQGDKAGETMTAMALWIGASGRAFRWRGINWR